MQYTWGMQRGRWLRNKYFYYLLPFCFAHEHISALFIWLFDQQIIVPSGQSFTLCKEYFVLTDFDDFVSQNIEDITWSYGNLWLVFVLHILQTKSDPMADKVCFSAPFGQ